MGAIEEKIGGCWLDLKLKGLPKIEKQACQREARKKSTNQKFMGVVKK